jgi:hypothetical protein
MPDPYVQKESGDSLSTIKPALIIVPHLGQFISSKLFCFCGVFKLAPQLAQIFEFQVFYVRSSGRKPYCFSPLIKKCIILIKIVLGNQPTWTEHDFFMVF